MRRAIFVDASTIIRHNYDIQSAPFATLRQLAEKAEVVVLTTDITQREIAKHIKADVGEAAASVTRASSQARVLKNLKDAPVKGLFEPLDVAASEKEIASNVRKYFNSQGFVTIRASDQPAGPVFERYFAGSPPFSRQKKDEFPDAFVVQALEDWAAKNGFEVTVVAEDKDFEAACHQAPHLQYEASLRSAVDMLLSEVQPHVSEVRAAVNLLMPDVLRAVSDSVRNDWVYLEDQWEGDVENIAVLEVRPTGDIDIVQLGQGTATAELDADIDLELDISYPDSASYYDGGYQESLSDTIRRTLSVPVSVLLTLKRDLATGGKPVVTIREVSLNRGERLTVNVEEEDVR